MVLGKSREQQILLTLRDRNRFTEVCCELSHPALCSFLCCRPPWLQQTGMAALQEKRAEMGGGTSHAGFGALPVTVPARLRDRKSSSRLLLAESPAFTLRMIFLWLPCSP